MNQPLQHIDTELLSAYLDREVEAAEARALETHLATCAGCRSRLESLRGVVNRLDRLNQLDAPVPPPWLGAQVRHHWKLRQQAAPWFLRAFQSLGRRVLAAPRATAAALVALAAGSLLAYTPAPLPEPPYYPEIHPGWIEVSDNLADVQPTTIQAAGKTFVFRERDDAWVEEGLQLLQPYQRIAAGSPVGRAVLTRHRDLGNLLSDGSRVVLRYRRATVELWAGS